MLDPELDPTSALAALMAANRRVFLRAPESSGGARPGRGPSLAVVGWLDAGGDAAAAIEAIEVFGSLGTRVTNLGGGSDGVAAGKPLAGRVVAALDQGGAALVVLLASARGGAEVAVFAGIEALLMAHGAVAERAVRRELRIVGGVVGGVVGGATGGVAGEAAPWGMDVGVEAGEIRATAHADARRAAGDDASSVSHRRIRWLGEHPEQAAMLASLRPRGPR